MFAFININYLQPTTPHLNEQMSRNDGRQRTLAISHTHTYVTSINIVYTLYATFERHYKRHICLVDVVQWWWRWRLWWCEVLQRIEGLASQKWKKANTELLAHTYVHIFLDSCRRHRPFPHWNIQWWLSLLVTINSLFLSFDKQENDENIRMRERENEWAKKPISLKTHIIISLRAIIRALTME